MGMLVKLVFVKTQAQFAACLKRLLEENADFVAGGIAILRVKDARDLCDFRPGEVECVLGESYWDNPAYAVAQERGLIGSYLNLSDLR